LLVLRKWTNLTIPLGPPKQVMVKVVGLQISPYYNSWICSYKTLGTHCSSPR